MPDGGLREVILRYYWLKLLEQISEIFTEELWLNFGHFIKLNKCIVKHCFIILLECLNDDTRHQGD